MEAILIKYMLQKFSWNSVMRHCHFVLGIPPMQFWNMTMVEVLELSQSFSDEQIITRNDLKYMIENFPEYP